MKHIYFITICLLIGLHVSAQSHEWQWAKTAVQPDNATSFGWTKAVATDAQGNSFVSGYFYTDSITFGSYTLRNTDQTGNTAAMYTAKYDPTGNVLWAQMAEGTGGYTEPLAICTDRSGNVYVGGTFSADSVSFNGHNIYLYPSDTTTDMFIVKYSSTGSFLWASRYGGDYYDAINGVATDPSGNVYMAGYFQSDSLLIGQTEYYNCSTVKNHNAILIKWDSTGNVDWVQTAITPNGGSVAYALCTDMSGHEIMAGRFGLGSSASFGSQTIQNDQTGYEDIFVVQYDTAGNALWAQDAGGSLDDYALGVAADGQSNIYITGYFNSPTAYFGSQSITNDTTDGTGDIYLAKCDINGNFQWVQSAGGDQTDVSNAVTTDTSGNAYITGYYLSPEIIFGNDTLLNVDNTGTTDDIFVAEFDPNGNSLPAVTIGGLSYDVGSGIATDQADNVYVAGVFRSDEIVFGPTTLDNCTPNHSFNPFIAKYASIPAGIINPNLLPTISLYPNPANDMIVAESQSFSSSDDVSATIYDVTGHVMAVGQSFSAGMITFNTGGLAAGMYLIKFTVGGREANAKFVKVADW